ncbi:MAG TPA: NAD(P)-dependent oxidoreductase [Vicinamibacterales bacterium]|jgi:3-hydroxyisobutyrate dehydrogenase-like beta-hydroxyacid dehydrogenase
MAKVAFLGTGLLGSAIAEGMLRRGDALTVWNRTESKARTLEPLGAKVARSAGEAVVGAERVHMTLSDDAVVDRVLQEIVTRLSKDAIVVDHTTTAPSGTRARYQAMHKAGVRFVHAPVFMSPQMARDAVGILMTSCPEPLFEAVREPLQKMSGEAWYLGDDPQRAAAYKIFGNSMIFVVTAGVADVFAMAKGLGISPEDALKVFSKFQPGGVIKARGEKIARRDFSATFELTMARKDMRLMIEAAGRQPLAVLTSIAARMDDAIANGHGAEDLAVIAAEVV